MAYETILYEEDGPIGTLTLNRPDDGNMFTPVMCHEVRDCINEMRRETRTRVLVITANGSGLSIEDHGQDGGGGNPCPTTASVSGVTATFTANQTCMSDDAGGGFTVASGTATVSGNMLAYDVSLSFLGGAGTTGAGGARAGVGCELPGRGGPKGAYGDAG